MISAIVLDEITKFGLEELQNISFIVSDVLEASILVCHFVTTKMDWAVNVFFGTETYFGIRRMAFGTFFKKIISGAKNIVGKVAPIVRKGANVVGSFAPVVSDFARKFGPIGETVGGVVDTVGSAAKSVGSWMDANQSAIDAFSGSGQTSGTQKQWNLNAKRFNGPILVH